MKRLFFLFALLLCAVPAYAQFTTVSATVTGADSQVWFGSGTGPGVASYSISFVPAANNPQGPYFFNGSAFNVNQVFSGFLNGSGQFSGVSVPSNTSITPSGSTWLVTVCPQASFPCFQQNFTISGASQALTITPPAIKVNIVSQPTPRVVAYTDAEIISPSVGSQYFNSTDNSIHLCTAGGSPCNWVSVTAGANILPLNNTFTGLNTDTQLHTFNGGIATTTETVSGQITSTVSTGTPPFVVSSTTLVPNLSVATAVSATTAGSATNATNLSGPGTVTGNYTHSGTETFSGPLNSTNSTSGISSCIINGSFVAGSSCYATIVAAVTAANAAPNGSVFIPSTYPGTDAPAILPTVGFDLRHGQVGFSHFLATMYPISGFPLGADSAFGAHGPGDSYVGHNLDGVNAATTTTANLSVGANTNILVGSTSNLAPSGSGVGLVIGRDTANEENISSANWSIVDATHINVTCANTHTGTTDIEQLGVTHLQNGVATTFQTNPAAHFTNAGTPYRLQDAQGNFFMYTPGNISDTFPFGAVGYSVPLTGFFPPGAGGGALTKTPADFVVKNASAAVCTRLRSSTAGGNINLLSSCDGNVTLGATLVLSSTTFASLGTPVNGSLYYCSDCTIANPCAGGGTGALAKRLNSVWVCN